jgi:hypothetical protein
VGKTTLDRIQMYGISYTAFKETYKRETVLMANKVVKVE